MKQDERQIVEKPWGRETLIEVNDKYVVKTLEMWAGHRCSLQYHEMKHETVYVLQGVLKVTIGDSPDSLTERILRKGDTIVILPGQIHRMTGIEDAMYLEASTTELEDVVRLSDDYGRS